MTYGVVYRLTCLVNGKCYHGQTVRSPETRWQHHQRRDSHCHALRHALVKYGIKSFKLEVVAEANSKEELDALEIEYIRTSLAPLGYNLKTGGAKGRPSEETRRKLSLANKVAQNRPEVKAKNSAGVRRAFASPEARAGLRARSKEATNRPGVREKMSQRMKTIHALPEQKERRSTSLRKSWASLSTEDRASRISAQRKACESPEYREKMSRASKASMACPEVKARHRAGIQAAMTPEERAARGARMKSVHARPGFGEARATAISKAHRSPEGKRKLALRRRRGESIEAWEARIKILDTGAA